MEFQLLGGNAVQISAKNARVLVDPLGAKPEVEPDKKINIILATQERFAGDHGEAFVINGPGEYEISGISVNGIAARAHTDSEDEQTATIFKVMNNTVHIAILGHIDPNIADDELEKIGRIDILFVPVGGNGYTLDAIGAAKVIRAIEPKVVIPTHYAQKGVTYEVPQAELDLFLKEMGVSEHEQTDKYKIKGELPERLTVVELTR